VTRWLGPLLAVVVSVGGCGGVRDAPEPARIQLAASASAQQDSEVRILVSGEGELDVTLIDPRGRRARCKVWEKPVNEIPNCHADIDYVHDVSDESPALPATMFELERPESGTWRLSVKGHRREQLQLQVERRLPGARFCGAEDIARAGSRGAQAWSMTWNSAPGDTCWVRVQRVAPQRAP
jgi:hypothetical protein